MPNQLTAQERASGWRLLFDGREPTEWRVRARDPDIRKDDVAFTSECLGFANIPALKTEGAEPGKTLPMRDAMTKHRAALNVIVSAGGRVNLRLRFRLAFLEGQIRGAGDGRRRPLPL